MTEFLSGLISGLLLLVFVLINVDKLASDMDLSLKIGNILCEDHKGLQSFDIEEYTCGDNAVIAPAGRASNGLLQSLEQPLDK